jgi:hypothetical protein
MTAQLQGWPEPYIYGEYTIILAGKSPNIQSYTVYIYGSGQPYTFNTIYSTSKGTHTHVAYVQSACTEAHTYTYTLLTVLTVLKDTHM